MNDVGQLLARAQVVLAFYLVSVFAGLSVAVVFAIARGHINLDGAVGTLITTAITAAITMAGMAINYFFSRQRHGQPDNVPVNPTPPPSPEPPPPIPPETK
jgi:hypothetical protein